MPNRPTITAYKKMDRDCNFIDWQVEVYDDNVHTYFLFPNIEDVPKDHMELLTLVIKTRHDTDNQGSSCDDVNDIIDYIREHKCAVCIDNTLYQWDDIKEVMSYDWRNVYLCPVCGWESWDDDCGDCPNCENGGQMQFSEQEHFEL